MDAPNSQAAAPSPLTDCTEESCYDIHPSFSLAPGVIHRGYDVLADYLHRLLVSGRRRIAFDGYGGTQWDCFQTRLQEALARVDLHPRWYDVRVALRSEGAIQSQIDPYLGNGDPLFGVRYPGQVQDLFQHDHLDEIRSEVNSSDVPVIIYGVGASLIESYDFLGYVDVPKDELQQLMRVGSFRNLGTTLPLSPKEMYKRCYFIDWPILNRHKQILVQNVDLVVDGTTLEAPTFMSGDDLRSGLSQMATSCVRARPWFAPGPWGGQWMKQHFRGLPSDSPNYAWSFELIAPENGIVFVSNEHRLEVSFDWLMFHDQEAVLGRAADQFGFDFPIRFDYLDTMGGGNLSIQCHPRPDYIRDHFGEPFTQDETYYIMDCEPNARVYLGFKEKVNSDEFRSAVERSGREVTKVDIDRYVNSVESRKHELLLIPNGTIHGSSAGNLVLEISATPYIFTFKIYDWLRRDLDGAMRPLNIDRAWQNLDFTRSAGYVRNHLITRPRTLATGQDWQLVHLPTHAAHFYDIHRLEFYSDVAVDTEDRCHVLNLVEGQSVMLETATGHERRVNFGETVVVPAAVGSYRVSNESAGICRMVKAFVK